MDHAKFARHRSESRHVDQVVPLVAAVVFRPLTRSVPLLRPEVKRMKRTAVEFVIVVLLGMIARPAEAFVGQVRTTITIPAAAQCTEDSGTAVAVVPGGKIGFPQIPVLLVTSCTNKLFFLDPANPATPVLTPTTPLPPPASSPPPPPP